VALVQGEAYGGGAGLVAACDWAVAHANARFRFPEVRIGGMPAMLAPYLIEAVGARTARGLGASALPFDAQQALAFGLVHEVVGSETEFEGVLKRFAGLALENAPGAVEGVKHLMRDVAGKRIDDGLAKDGARRVAVQRASEEGKEGAAALLGRRPPQWDRGQQ
jgi:methylglutaconyl-CoA hydratase